MGNLDLTIFIVYLLGVAIFGFSFFQKNKSTNAFTIGNSRLPGWIVSLSFFATFVSSISYLALPGSTYLANWNPFVFSLSIPIAALIAVRFFIPIYRSINSPSAYTYLEQRFGTWASLYASICYLLTQLMRVGTILYLLALALNTIIGWDIAWVILLTGLFVGTYSIVGGIQAVIWTDAVQAIVLILGALVCALYIPTLLPGGFKQLFSIAYAADKFSLGSFAWDWSTSTFWVVLIYGIFINLQNYGIDQNYVQRYMTVESEKTAKQSALIGGLLYLPVSALFLFIGTALFAYYQSGVATLPADLQNAAQSDQIFPHFIVHTLPTGLKGLLIAAIFAAGMSTISTSFNSGATVILKNLHERYFGKNHTEQTRLWVLYGATALMTMLGILIGITMINVKSALDAWWKLASIFSGGMLGLFLLGAFTQLTHTVSGIIAVSLGVVVIFVLSLSTLYEMDTGLHSYLTIVFGTSTIFMTGFLLSLILLPRN